MSTGEALPPLAAEEATPIAPITFKKRGARAKGGLRKRPAVSEAPPNRSDSDDSSSGDEGGDLKGPTSKRRKKALVSASSADNKTANDGHGANIFHANRDIPITDSNDATKRKDWYDQPTTKGPTRAASNVRVTIMTDFKPDICKDYNKTGWCGFGDSCIFLHDRTDIKQGWQLDKEWENVTKNKKDLGGTIVASANRDNPGEKQEEDDEKMLESIPFRCIICEEPYKQPIVTRCGHYFCEPCALKRYRKDPTCKNCGAATNGVFNTASKLEKLLSRKKQREAERAEKSAAEEQET